MLEEFIIPAVLLESVGAALALTSLFGAQRTALAIIIASLVTLVALWGKIAR
jgi:Mn2+/Fe2+ NRAMP family transporter